MHKRVKLGIAATSLAAAATMIVPATASADEWCVVCPGDTAPLTAVQGAFDNFAHRFGEDFPAFDKFGPVFEKHNAILEKITSVFHKW